MEGGGIWVAISLAIVHGALWGGGLVRNSRSNLRNHHSHACNTTSLPLQGRGTQHTPSPGRVVVVGALKDGVETLNDTAHTAANPTPNCAALASDVITFSSKHRTYFDWQ